MAAHSQPFSPRQSMNVPGFEVFHYRARQQENIPIHHHDFYEVYFFRSGKVDFRVEGRTYRLEPGDVLLIGPQQFHQAIVDPNTVYERFVLWIDKAFLVSVSTPDMPLWDCFDRSTDLLRPDKLPSAALLTLLEPLIEEFYSNRPGGPLYARGLFLQLMVTLNRLVRGRASGVLVPEAPDLISQVLTFIGSHFEEPITLEQLSAEFFVSKYHLSREFRQRVGTSLYHYVICKRLLRARELMDEGQAPGAVYQSCGFGDYANFYRAFRSEYGLSPKDYCTGQIKLASCKK